MSIIPKFRSRTPVFHITPDSEQGVILDYRVYPSHNIIEYFVTFGRRGEDYGWYNENELTDTKQF